MSKDVSTCMLNEALYFAICKRCVFTKLQTYEFMSTSGMAKTCKCTHESIGCYWHHRCTHQKILPDVVLATPGHNGEDEANDVQPAVARPLGAGSTVITTSISRYCLLLDLRSVAHSSCVQESRHTMHTAKICCHNTCAAAQE